jgi:hypothetical protein
LHESSPCGIPVKLNAYSGGKSAATHRQVIYSVSEADYRLLNEEGQEEAAGASLVNAQAVLHAPLLK